MANNKVQDYGEMATTFQRVVNVVDHFESYNHIEQVAELTSRVKKIKSELSVRAKREFEEMFTNPFAKVRERTTVGRVMVILGQFKRFGFSVQSTAGKRLVQDDRRLGRQDEERAHQSLSQTTAQRVRRALRGKSRSEPSHESCNVRGLCSMLFVRSSTRGWTRLIDAIRG